MMHPINQAQNISRRHIFFLVEKTLANCLLKAQHCWANSRLLYVLLKNFKQLGQKSYEVVSGVL